MVNKNNHLRAVQSYKLNVIFFIVVLVIIIIFTVVVVFIFFNNKFAAYSALTTLK